MKQQHTPGPWQVKRGNGIYAGNSYLSLVLTENQHDGDLPYEANARLMAAAPKMLEFIKKVAHWELVECDMHEYVMEDEEVRIEAHRILNDLYNEKP